MFGTDLRNVEADLTRRCWLFPRCTRLEAAEQNRRLLGIGPPSSHSVHSVERVGRVAVSSAVQIVSRRREFL